jgi:hypothetical protein
VTDRCGDLLVRKQPLFEIGAKKYAAKFAGAEHCETLLRKFGTHGQNIVTE